AFDPNPQVVVVTNLVPVFTHRVGANSPLLMTTNGVTNQWTFFLYQNISNYPYLAFATFLPPNLSLPRTNDADIDMFVSMNPGLTNLDPAVLNDVPPNTYKALG